MAKCNALTGSAVKGLINLSNIGCVFSSYRTYLCRCLPVMANVRKCKLNAQVCCASCREYCH